MARKSELDLKRLDEVLVLLANQIKDNTAPLNVLNALFILRAVKEKGVFQAAKILQVTPPTIYRILRKYSI